MIDILFGTKIESTRVYNQAGVQLPVTKIRLQPMIVTQVKDEKKDGYYALQFGLGEKKTKRTKKPLQGHLKRAELKKAPFYFREIRLQGTPDLKPGDSLSPAAVLKAGDLVDVTGISKGRGFTGVMKRWGFAGGPRTHGQSDRQRAPGSIGQTTTPGRVFPGKKMAGRSGSQKTTIKNLPVLDLDQEKGILLVKGLVPGARHALLQIRKIGQVKKFIPLYQEGEKITVLGEKRPQPSSKKETQETEVKSAETEKVAKSEDKNA